MRCGGPAIELSQRSPADQPAAVCITCGYEFPLDPHSAGRSGIPCAPAIVLAVLVAGLLLGALFAVLSSAPNVGGWILILIGVGMVAFMGAFEAGYLDGLKQWLRSPRPPLPPPEA